MLRRITDGARKLKRYYDSKPALKAVGGGAMIYGGLKAAGFTVAAFFELKDVDDICHFVAPAASAWYLCRKAEPIGDAGLKTVIQTAVVGAACADIGRLASEYDQGIYAVHWVRNNMSDISDWIGNHTMVRSAEAQSFWTGAIATLGYKLKR